MSYQAQISRANPSAFLFLLDQSDSMRDGAPGCPSKAVQAADVLNRTLQNLVLACTKGEPVPRNYFHIGMIGYGQRVGNILPGAESATILRPIAEVAATPLRIEERRQRLPDGAGGLVEQTIKFPVWVEPAHANGTPMCAALELARRELEPWIAAHPDSFPPIVIHITDGESTDGDPTAAAGQLAALSTSDGNVLLFNLHYTGESVNPILFPNSDAGLPTEFAQRLFQISSPLTPYMVEQARKELQRDVAPDARGYAYNADFAALVTFLDIGTRSSQAPQLR